MPRIFDITRTFSTDMPNWPGTPEPSLTRHRSMDEGDRNNVSVLGCHVHAGTHVDAPLHFVADGYGTDQLPLDILMGPCVVAHFPDGDRITADMLEANPHITPGVERLLMRTRNSDLYFDEADFRSDFIALTPDAAHWLVDHGIRLVGNDYLSVERFREPGNATHLALLEKQVVLVEGLDLRAIAPGPYHLICLPMKILNCDGAPARVVLTET